MKTYSNKSVAIYYIVIDTVLAGIGMGVPFFCILFGLPFGAFITKNIIATEKDNKARLGKILKAAWLSAGYTFLVMAALWLPQIGKLFDPTFDIANFGHPFILFEPRASFIGWLLLMIVIAPLLQVLTTIFASFLMLKKNQT